MPETTWDLTSFRFSTEDLPPSERLAMWHEVFGRSVSRRMISLLNDDPPNVDIAARRLTRSVNGVGATDGICVQRTFLSGGMSSQRTPDLMGDGNDDVVLRIHETGRCIAEQLGREAFVDPGGGLLTSNSDSNLIVYPEPTRFASIGLPRQLMAALAPGLEDAFLRPLPPDAGVLRLLMRYLDVLEDEDALGTVELRRAVATHLQDLCALAIGAGRDAAEVAKGRGLRAARLRAVKADIAEQLEHGAVSATALALRQGVSPRYVHKLFEGEGTTLSRYVLGQRLAHVHRLLTDPRHCDLTIAAIAYKVGFGDLSTFNREFRRRFGATPSDVRATAPIERRMEQGSGRS